MIPRPERLLLTMLGMLAAACDQENASFSATMVADSAGIAIVTSDPLHSIRRCTVSGEPSFAVGEVSGDDRYEFYAIRGLVRLSDGSVAVADETTSSVRIFSATGEYVRSMGRRGEGPGEFRDPHLMWTLPGDTIWVGNLRPWYFNVFTAAGEFVRIVQISPAYANPSRGGGVLSNGSSINVRVEGGGEDYRTPQDVFVDVHTRDGGLVGTLMTLEGRRYGPPSGPINLVLDPLFEAAPSVDADGATIAVTDGREPEVRLLDEEFRLRRIVRWVDGDRDVTAAHASAWREDFLERRRREGREPGPVADLMASEDRPVADRFPASSGVDVGRDGRVWVGRYPKPRESVGWLVFEGDGEFLCHLESVPGLEVWEFGADYLLGTREDALGVESVAIFPFQPPDDTDAGIPDEN
ncbi:MAG: 6-bladed beta-propeller [Gemmatimonadetes bacterium]|nr:6-bladed beta-propeller [Candidatus Palauibacter australiensis]